MNKSIMIGLGVILAHQMACLSSSSFSNIEIQGSTLTVEPDTVAANGMDVIHVKLWLKGGSQQFPLPNIELKMGAGTALVLTDMQRTNQEGQALARLISHEMGTHYLNVEAIIGHKSIPVAEEKTITFRAPSIYELSPNAVGLPGSFQLRLSMDHTYPFQVGFRSTDPLAQLPPAYTIESEQDIFHVFSGQLLFRTAGVQTLTIYNLATGETLNTQSFSVAPGSASVLLWQGSATTISAGQSITGTLILQDAYGNLATDYTGTLAFSSTIEQDNLPAPMIFTANDGGRKDVAIPRLVAGAQTLTLQDILMPQQLSIDLPIVVLPMQAHHLRFVQTIAATGCTVIPGLQVALTDVYGNLSPVDNVLLTLQSPGQPFQGTAQALTQAGIATFTDIRFQQLSNAEQLVASAPGFVDASSNPFAVTIDPPRVHFDSIEGVGGCVNIHYTVSQACAMPVDMLIDYKFNQQAYKPATGSRRENGIYRLPTLSTGMAYTFAWNTSKDLPRIYSKTVALRLQAKTNSISGPMEEHGSVSIDNTVVFDRQSTTYGISASPIVTIGDLNKDGKQDVVVFGDSPITTLAGDGNGGYSALSTIGYADPVAHSQSVDFNHDGHLDLMFHSPTTQKIAIAFGLGTGAFDSNVLLLTTQGIGLEPMILDVDRDSFPDIVLASGNNVQVFGNQRNQTFSNHTIAAQGPIVSMAAGDVDRNGTTDLLLGLASSQLQWMLGSSHTFVAQPSIPGWEGTSLSKLVLADVDRNGWLDIVAQPSLSDVLWTELRLSGDQVAHPTFFELPYVATQWFLLDVDKNGQMDILVQDLDHVPMWRSLMDTSPGIPWHTLGESLRHTPIHWVDANGDGYADILSFAENNLRIHWNEPASVACSEGFRGANTIQCSGGRAGIIDFNRDGTPDPIISCDWAPSFWLHSPLTDSDYLWIPGYKGYYFSYPGTFRQVTVKDFNNDSYEDILFLNDNGDQYTMSTGANTTLTYTQNPSKPPLNEDYLPIDYNHDGDMDMAYLVSASHQVALYQNNGTGLFLPDSQFTIPPDASRFESADLNQDNLSDLVVIHGDSSMITVWLGTANGGFVMQGDPIITPSFPRDLLLTDSNNDGFVDVLIYCDVSAQVIQLINDGLGQFNPFYAYRVQPNMFGMAAGDLNLDGYIDLLTAYPDTAETEIWFGRSFGIFDQTLAVILDSDVTARRPVVADVNNDRLPDVLVDGASMTLFYNLGGNRFNELYTIAAAPQCNGITTADYSGDGHMDVVTGCTGNRSVGLYLGDGQGKLKRRPMIFVNSNIEEILSADMNRDSVPDVITRNSSPNGFSVLLFDRQLQAFGSPQTIATPNIINKIRIDDLNGDGYLDVVAISDGAQRLYIYLGSAMGLPSSPSSTRTTGYGAYTMALADINRDGYPDILFGSDRVSRCLNQGNGTFAAPVLVRTAPSWLNRIEMMDRNRDGYQDILISVFADGLYIGYGGPGASFSPWDNNDIEQVYHLRYNGPTRAIATPLEEGGVDYIFAWMPEDKYNATWLTPGDNNGNSYFVLTGPASDEGIAIADMNEDGAFDLLSVSSLTSAQKSRITISYQYR